MTRLKIAMLQMNIVTGNYSENKKTVNRLLQNLKEEVDLIVLPEMWSVGFDFKNMKVHGTKYIEVLDDLKQIAAKRKAMVIGGSIPEGIGDKLFNSTFVIDRNGKIQDRYWKMHLVSQNNLEGQIFDKGERIPTFSIHHISFGIANCYDLRFPELFRGIAFNGSKIIFLVAQFPYPLYHHWITLLTARAIENQLYLIAVNRAGSQYFGHSAVISPTGEILYEADEKEGLHVVEIDTAEVDKIRNIRNDLLVTNQFAYTKKVYPSNYIGVGGLVVREGKILMVKQSFGKQKNIWSLPGGHVHIGESLETAVEREVFEETSIKAQANKIIAIRSCKNKNVTDCYIVFDMEYIEGEPVSDKFENTEVDFFLLEEVINKKDISPLAVEIIKNYFQDKMRGLKKNKVFFQTNENDQLYFS